MVLHADSCSKRGGKGSDWRVYSSRVRADCRSVGSQRRCWFSPGQTSLEMAFPRHEWGQTQAHTLAQQGRIPWLPTPYLIPLFPLPCDLNLFLHILFAYPCLPTCFLRQPPVWWPFSFASPLFAGSFGMESAKLFKWHRGNRWTTPAIISLSSTAEIYLLLPVEIMLMGTGRLEARFLHCDSPKMLTCSFFAGFCGATISDW